MKTPNLETDRLLLRPFEINDAQEVFECWESDPAVAKEELHIEEIIAGHAKENIACENVLRKLGFIYEKDISYECNNGTVMREGKLHRLELHKSPDNE